MEAGLTDHVWTLKDLLSKIGQCCVERGAEMSESLDGEKLPEPAPKDRYDASIKALQFELDLFWKRSLFFWGFIAAAFVAYTAKQLSAPLQAAIASFGFVCSSVWTLVNRGSKYWYVNWEEKVIEAELPVTGPLYGNPVPEKESGGWLRGRRLSPSKLVIALSDFVALLWLGLLIEKSVVLVSTLADWKEWLTLVFVVFSLVYGVGLFSRSHFKVKMK